jgi:hypothetical protein
MTLYMRYVDAKNNVSVQSHQVWDRDRFLATRKADWEKEGGTATEVNQEVYRRHAWGK